jgi:hypothetical protein
MASLHTAMLTAIKLLRNQSLVPPQKRIRSHEGSAFFEALAGFFLDYLLRKVMAKPPEYTQWPPALRLFYRFLAEKGYLDDPEPLIASLYAIEPDFIAWVKQRS